MPRNRLIRVRRGTAAQWSLANPILASGEPGQETDTNKLKIGDGVTAWNSLGYIGSGVGTAAGSSGQVQFNSSGVFAASSDFHWDNGSSFLGLGNAAPSQRLHVTGNLRVTGAYYDSSNSAGSSGQVLASTGTGTDWVSLSEITGVDGSGTLNYLPKWTPDGNSIGNSQVFDDGTNVGIAATTLSARLHVKGSGNTSATNAFNVENSSGTHVFRVRDDGGIHIGPTTSASSGAFISPSDGADNIGTTVSSGLRYRSALGTSVAGADHFFRNYQGNRQYTSGVGSMVQVSAPFYPTSGTGVWAGIQVDATINQTGGASGISRGLWINSNVIAAADFRAIETANGPWRLTDTYASGSGSLAGPAMVINQTWNTTGTPTAFQVNVTDTASNVSSLLADFRVGGSSRAQIRKNGSGWFSLEVDSGSSFRVLNNSGFFSIGSTPDTYLFRDAANVLAQRNGVTAQTHRIYNTYTDASNYERGFIRWSSNVLQIGGEAAGTGSSRDLQLFTGGTAKVTVDTTGRVGVGITAPTGYMHLVAPTGAGFANLIHLVKSGGFGTGWVDIQYTGGTFESFLCADTNTDPTAKISCWQDTWDGGNRPGSIRFYTRPSGGSVTERMRITSTGNVGIGVTTVNAPLQFPATLSSRKIVLYEVSNNDHQVYGFGIDSAILRYQVANSAANHIFYAGATSSSSTELMRITGTGNVGMGSTSPGARTHIITSSSSAKGLIVQGSASQTATLQEWQNNSGTMLSQVLASGVFQSAVSTGTAPFIVASTTAVTNLNADLLDGQHGSYYTNYVQSRLQNLVTNGSGLLGNNTNFSSFVFNSTERFAGGGSFTYNGADTALQIDELIPVDIGKIHQMTYYAKLLNKSIPAEEPRHYGMIVSYDADGLIITPYNISKVTGSTYTTLAVDLNPGDLTITLTDATGWYSGPASHQRSIGFYPYTNSQGYTYPDYTYTRNVMTNGVWAEGGISGNVITLAAPYAGVARPAGTKVANHQSGGTYDYIAGSFVVTQTSWTKYNGIIGPTGSFYTVPVEGNTAGSNGSGDMMTAPNGFRYGTAFIKLGWLLSYNTPSGTAQTAISAVSFGLDPRHDDYYRSVSDGTALAPAYSFINDTDIGMFRPTTNELGFSTTGSERIRITSTGNVAIGSTSATEKLFVNAGNILLSSGYGIRCSDNFRLYDTTSSIDRFLFSTSNSYNTRSSGSHIFQVNGTQLAVLNSSGNMGIGVSTPTAKLDVSGSQVSGFSLLLRSGDTSGGTDSVQIGFAYDNSADYRHSIRTRHNSASPTGNAIDFWLWQHGTDAAATLGSLRVVSINGINGGSLGVGTATPVSKFEIFSGNSSVMTISNSSPGSNASPIEGKIHFRGYGNSALAEIAADDRQSNSTGGRLFLRTADTSFVLQNRLMIDREGNVGINTTSPSHKLDVNSSSSRFGGTTYGYLILSDDWYGGEFGLVTEDADSIAVRFSDGTFRYGGGIGSETLIISGSNVGINTITPGSELDVKGTLRLSGSSSGYVGFAPAAAAGSTTYTLPSADGTSGQVLSTNGSGTLSWSSVSGSVSDGDKGDLTVSSSGTVWTIDNGVVTNSKLADVATATFKGRTTAGTGSPEDLTATQATALLNVFTSGLNGLAPASGGGTSNFLRADGTWTAPTFSAPTPVIYSPTTTTSVTETNGEVVVLADATSGNLTVNLPTAVGNTAKITIKKIDSSANTVIIDGSTTETIDGSLTKTIEFQYTSVSLIGNGSNWFII